MNPHLRPAPDVEHSFLPWEAEPYKLWSFFEMLRFPMADWITIVGFLKAHETQEVTSEQIDEMVEILDRVSDACDRLGLRLAAKHAVRIKENVQAEIGTLKANPDDASLDMSDAMVELNQRLIDEIEDQVFVRVALDRALYIEKEALFGETVNSMFPDAIYDIQEAGNCYALRRNTAAAFHCVRVLEHGLLALNQALGGGGERPNWEPMLKKIQKEVDAPYEARQFRGHHDFFARVLEQMVAIKHAWRNRVMHIGTNYDDDQAYRILLTTHDFMRFLATDLPKRPLA